MNICSKGAVVAGVLAAVGCASEKPEQGIIAKEWSVNTRQLAINPIFPPRERFYPGDLYVVPYFATRDPSAMLPLDYTLMSHRFDHVDLSQLITAEQALKPMPELTTYKDEAGKDVSPWPVGVYPDTKGRANGVVAFPGFTFASASSTQLGANVATSGWGGAFGGAQESHYTVSYSVPAAEYVSVPMRAAMAEFRAWRVKLRNDHSALEDLETLSKTVLPPGRNDARAVLVFPNEVFYARAIDVTVSADEAMSARMSAVTASMIEASETKTALQENLTTLRGTAAADAQQQAEQDAQAAKLQARIDSLQARIEQSARSVLPSVPGVTGSVTRSSAYGVTLRQTFRYPVAIGYRGMHFYVSALDSDAPGGAVGGTPAPVAEEPAKE